MPRLPRAFPSPRRSPISRIDHERLLVEADGPLRLAQGGVGEAQVAEGGPLAPAVADLAIDRQVLLVEADGPLRLAQEIMGQAQHSQEPADRLRPQGAADRLGQERFQEAQPLAHAAVILQPVRDRSQPLERPVVLARLEQMVPGLNVGLDVGRGREPVSPGRSPLGDAWPAGRRHRRRSAGG